MGSQNGFDNHSHVMKMRAVRSGQSPLHLAAHAGLNDAAPGHGINFFCLKSEPSGDLRFSDMAMGHSLCRSHFGSDEHPCATYSLAHSAWML